MIARVCLLTVLSGVWSCTETLEDYPRDNPRDPEFTGAATCGDGVKNGVETDVDCGGLRCDPCANQGVCETDEDCESRRCRNSRCQGCGDGVFWPESEECDDGDLQGGDGCDSGCAIEPGWSCTTDHPTVCYQCGDDVLQTEVGEECDDSTDPYCIDCMVIGSCGDGDIQTEAGEECDDAGPSVGCTSQCRSVCAGLCVVSAQVSTISSADPVTAGTLELADAGFERGDSSCDAGGTLCVLGAGLAAATGEEE